MLDLPLVEMGDHCQETSVTTDYRECHEAEIGKQRYTLLNIGWQIRWRDELTRQVNTDATKNDPTVSRRDWTLYGFPTQWMVLPNFTAGEFLIHGTPSGPL